MILSICHIYSIVLDGQEDWLVLLGAHIVHVVRGVPGEAPASRGSGEEEMVLQFRFLRS